VFSGDNTFQRKNVPEQFIESLFAAPFSIRIASVHHHVNVNIAIARVPKAGDGQAVFLLQGRCETKQIFQPATRHDDIFIELG